MQRIEKSGCYHSNLLTFSMLSTLKDILGDNGLVALLRYADVEELMGVMPPKNLDDGVDFADMSSIFQAVEEIYGVRGGHALLTRCGRKTFEAYRENFAPLMNYLTLELKLVPHEKRVKQGIDFTLKLLTRTGAQHVTCLDSAEDLVYQIKNNSACYGRSKTDHAVCHMTVGEIQGILHCASSGEDRQVVESLCAAKGDLYCEFHVSNNPIISSGAAQT
jgi:predicted hydrocarbon binding protein